MQQPKHFYTVSSIEDLIYRCAEISATKNGLMIGIDTFDQSIGMQKLIASDVNNIVIPVYVEITPRVWEYGANKVKGKIVLQGELSIKFDLSGWVID